MNRNVEIKARVRSPGALRARVASLATSGPVELIQEDRFFDTPRGRLKLRTAEGQAPELIYYERPDAEGPAESRYVKVDCADPGALEEALRPALGVRAIVRKRRELFRCGRTRIHLDEVEGLGSFIELEVVLEPDEAEEVGREVAAGLMRRLEIEERDLVREAYADLLATLGRDAGGEASPAAVVEITLPTPRLRLRPFREADLDAYAAICADQEVMRFLGGPISRQEAWRHLATILGHWRLRGFGLWAVEERRSGGLAGRLGFLEPEGWPGFELAWMLGRPFWGLGYASEAAEAALAWAFSRLGRRRVISLIHPRNERSLRLAERLGARRVGNVQHFGEELLLFALERRRWLARSGARAAEGATLREDTT